MRRVIVQGVNGIKFVKIVEESKLRNPIKGFAEESQHIEYRRDPLLGRWCRINILRSKRPKQAEKAIPALNEIIESSACKCPFCKERINEKTPMFPSRIIPEGRVWFDSASMFPNLHPFAKYHSIVVLDVNKHYTELGDLNPKILYDAFEAMIEASTKIYKKDKRAKYVTVSMNFLFPAGASIIHPHLQVIQDTKPTWLLRMEILKSRRYYRKFNSNYWLDLVESEKKLSERHVFDSNVASWISSFAPLANYEITGVVKRKTSIIEFTSKELRELACDISKVLNSLAKIGVMSANMTFYDLGFNSGSSEFFNLHIRIIGRKNPYPNYTNDRGFMEALHLEPVIEMLPEDLTLNIKRVIT